MNDPKESDTSALKQEIEFLKRELHSLEEQTEFKQKAIADLAREKERLSIDLRKHKRSNANLKQQLEDERTFYIKEKEHYCQEMNEVKKLKRRESERNLLFPGQEDDNRDEDEEKEKLKAALKETLQANYNLSVKFLRMKNTKFCIKNRLKKLQTEHDKILQDLKQQVERFHSDLENVLCKPANRIHISPSNKKYLQIMKMNSHLLHENLDLQAQIDRLNYELDTIKTNQVQQETSSKYKYLRAPKKSSKPEAEAARKPCKDAHIKIDKESQTDIRLTDEILVSEFVRTTICTKISDVSTANCDCTERSNDLLSETGNFEVVRTRSAPGIMQNEDDFREDGSFGD